MNKKLKITLIVLGSILVFFLAINIIPPKKVMEDNPFIIEKGSRPLIAAHRGGTNVMPENTMKAYKNAVENCHADIIESDLYLTKDGYLVYNHDSYVDETCNINGDISLDQVEDLIDDKKNRHYISDLTLNELKQYNFGYYFEKNGERPYKELTPEQVIEEDLQIVEVQDLFEEFYVSHPDLMFIVEIKNGNEAGFTACDKLAQVLEQYPGYKDQIVIGTFNPEIEEYLKDNYPDLMRGASTAGAAGFVITQMLGVNIFNANTFSCLQIPTEYDIKGIEIKLDKKTYINRAHRRNISVQFWTINDKEEMRRLIEMGADVIMTDNPDVMYELLVEMGYYN